MNNFENVYVLTGAEIYTLAAVCGVRSIFGLFDGNSFPDSKQLPVVLASLAQKGFVTQRDGRLVVKDHLGRMISCYNSWDRALAVYFADNSAADLCVIRSEGQLLYMESVLRQPNAVRLRFIDTDRLCAELEESESMECVPACPLDTAEPEESEGESGLNAAITVRLQHRSGQTDEAAVLLGTAGCFLRECDGRLSYAHRAGVIELIGRLLTGEADKGVQDCPATL